jgi:hypothetical protein
MPPIVTTVFIVIPPDKVLPMLEALRAADHQLGDESPPAERLMAFLRRALWQVHQTPDGQVYLTGYSGEALDLQRDPILVHAVGHACAGSFIQGYSQDNTQWLIRYYKERKTLVHGNITFPGEPAWGRQARSLIWVREAQQGDLPSLMSLSPLPIDWGQGTILVAERAGRVLAFLQYHSHPQDAQTGVITRLATQPNGRIQGYPQAIVTYLKKIFRSLIVTPLQAASASSDYKRMWRALGFVQQELGEESKRKSPQFYYTWPGPRDLRERRYG